MQLLNVWIKFQTSLMIGFRVMVMDIGNKHELGHITPSKKLGEFVSIY